MTKVYVTCNDIKMSGWGRSENKINKIIIACSDLKQAKRVMTNLKGESQYKYINICKKKPSYDLSKYYISEYIADDCTWWNR